MTQAKESIKPQFTKSLSGQIVQLHPFVEEKLSLPDDVWHSLKNWKAELQYIGEECDYLLKMITWNGAATKTSEDKRILTHFEKLINKDHVQLVRSINEIEKEVVAAFFEEETKANNFQVKMRKVEAELKIFNKDLSIIKLKVLKLIINNSRITFF